VALEVRRMAGRTIGLDTGANVLDRLSGYSRDRLAQISSDATFGAGVTILEEGQPAPFLATVQSGRVALQLRVPELGDRVTILTVEPGELLGWSAVVAPYRVTVDAVATERTRLRLMRADVLRLALAEDCDLAMELLPIVLESLSARLGGSWHQLLDLFANRTPTPW
jgi:CRP/FNR family cyclic AMP-dependent transcriptional regulator